MLAEVGLGLSVVLAGLWSGLLLAVVTLLHPMYAALDGGEFAVELQRFLPVARKSPTNWVSVIGLVSSGSFHRIIPLCGPLNVFPADPVRITAPSFKGS